MLGVLVLLILTRMIDTFIWLPPEEVNTKRILYNYLFEFIAFLPVIFLLKYSYKEIAKKNMPVLTGLLVVVFVLFLPGVVLFVTHTMGSLFTDFNIKPYTLQLVEKYTPGGSLVILFLSATYWITNLILQSAKQKETAHKAETLAKDVQLKMLRYQINPHFLFNVLNSIYGLIDENSTKAKKLVLDMSEYYRYTLNKQEMTISVEKEVESVLKYLEIQKTRFEEEFEFEISVEEPAKQVLIPSFIIHLLIENAVKYGTKTEKKKLIISLLIGLAHNRLSITVSNTGKLFVSDLSTSGHSIGTSNGIENLKHRLELYYNENSSFSLTEKDGWVIATIEINNIAKK